MGKYDLPDKIEAVCTEMEEFTWLIYGTRKIGKTTLAAQFPDPYFMFFERGGKSISAKKEYIPDWNTFLKKLDRLEKDPSYCETVVIDTGFMCYERCFTNGLDKFEIDSPKDEGWGNAWKLIEREFRDCQDFLIGLGFGLVVIAHSEMVTIKKKNMPEYTRIKTELGKQAFRWYNANADVIVYYDYDDDGDRVLQVGGDSSTEAGVRIDNNFFYTNGDRIKEIKVENEMERAAYSYKMLKAAFHNKLEKGGKLSERTEKRFIIDKEPKVKKRFIISK